MSIKEIARMFNDKISGCEEDFFCGTKTSFMQFWKSFVLFLIFTPSIDCWNVTFFLIHQNRNWVKKRQHSRATKTFNGINYKKKITFNHEISEKIDEQISLKKKIKVLKLVVE